MKSLILITVLGSWGYDGFNADPAVASRRPVSPPAGQPSAQPEARAARRTGVVLGIVPYDAPGRRADRGEPPPRSIAPTVKKSPPPTAWRLADDSGQVWKMPRNG